MLKLGNLPSEREEVPAGEGCTRNWVPQTRLPGAAEHLRITTAVQLGQKIS